MGLSTVNWDRVVALAEAKIGADLTDKSAARLGHLINAAARYIYDESRYHPRFLVLEARTATDGYISATESGLDEIDEVISYWSGERWVGANPSEVYGYPDSNGFKLTTNFTGTVYVAYKKVLPDSYGDGTLGTSGDFPAEWLNYCAQSAAQQWMESNRRPESFNPISVRSVEKLEGQVLVKANRQGAFDTIGNIWTTRYAKDTTATGHSGSVSGGGSGGLTGNYYLQPDASDLYEQP